MLWISARVLNITNTPTTSGDDPWWLRRPCDVARLHTITPDGPRSPKFTHRKSSYGVVKASVTVALGKVVSIRKSIYLNHVLWARILRYSENTKWTVNKTVNANIHQLLYPWWFFYYSASIPHPLLGTFDGKHKKTNPQCIVYTTHVRAYFVDRKTSHYSWYLVNHIIITRKSREIYNTFMVPLWI